MKPTKPRELADRIIKHPQGGLKALLDLVDRSETEWLELKAATYPLGGVFDEKSNEHDFRWDVAKAVIAMANSVGGIVLVGVNDEGQPVGLEASDPSRKRERQGAEAFRRETILEQVLLPSGGWRTKKHGNFKVKNRNLLERLITLQEIPYGQTSALAILVDSVPRGFGHVVVEKTMQRSTDQIVYVRMRGTVGRNVELQTDDPAVVQTQHEQSSLSAQESAFIWDSFLAGIQQAKPAHELISEIRRHVQKIADDFSWLRTKFVPLAAERIRTEEPNTSKLRDKTTPRFPEHWATKQGSSTNALEVDSTEIRKTEPQRVQGLVTVLLNAQNRALLIGEAGSGKSTCLQEIALQTAAEWAPGRKWPIYVPLSAFSSDGISGILEKYSGIQWHNLVARIRAGEVTLLLDALNECSDSLYDQCQSEINALLSEYPKASVFISTRSSNIPDTPQLATFEVKPLDRRQQIQLLETFVGNETVASGALKTLCHQPGGEAIASSPVLLRIVSEIAQEHGEIPAGRAALYRIFIETWHRRESQNRETEFPWDVEQVVDALSTLAFVTRKRGLVTCQLSYARNVLLPLIGEKVDQFIEHVTEGLVLTQNEANGTINFWHETIQEYLCAEYLVARHEDLSPDVLCGNTETKIGTWAMAVAFVLELAKNPSKTLINAAWRAEPLMTAAAVGDTALIKDLSIEGDAWTRGVMRLLLGEVAAEEERELTIAARLPPKYPISPQLVSTLRGGAFWYAAQTNEFGRKRAMQLQQAICAGRFPWIELLPLALKANSTWSNELGPALGALTGAKPNSNLTEVLRTATIAELCALRRSGKISSVTFLSNWEQTLGASAGGQLELELVDILRSERESTNELLRRMLARYSRQLRKIALEKNLSLRLLNILVGGGAISAHDIRRDYVRLNEIVARMSTMNAVRLARSGVVRRSDLNEADIDRLVYAGSPKEINMAIATGLLRAEDIPEDFQRQHSTNSSPILTNGEIRKTTYLYSTRHLSDSNLKREMETELRKARFKVKVKYVHPENSFGFATHPDFERDIFFLLSAVSSNDYTEISAGQTLDVRVCTRFDQKKKEWGFAVESGRVLIAP